MQHRLIERIAVPMRNPTNVGQLAAKIIIDLERKQIDQTTIAKGVKVSQPTISRWKKGDVAISQFNFDNLRQYAINMGVLDQESIDLRLIPVVGFVGAGGTVLYSEGQGPFGEAPMPPRGAKKETVAVQVRGDSMAGQFEDGWLVYYDNRHDPPSDDIIGKPCVVGLTDGRVLIKRLFRGDSPGRYVLLSVNAPPLLNVAVEWAAPVTWIGLP